MEQTLRPDRARPGATGDARHRGLPGGGHRPAPHHAGTAGHRDVVRPPDGQAHDIRTSVIDPGRPVGPHPNPRRPPPGTKKVRRGPGG